MVLLVKFFVETNCRSYLFVSGYIDRLIAVAFELRKSYPCYREAQVLADERLVPPPVCARYPKPCKEELVSAHKSRFNKWLEAWLFYSSLAEAEHYKFNWNCKWKLTVISDGHFESSVLPSWIWKFLSDGSDHARGQHSAVLLPQLMPHQIDKASVC